MIRSKKYLFFGSNNSKYRNNSYDYLIKINNNNKSTKSFYINSNNSEDQLNSILNMIKFNINFNDILIKKIINLYHKNKNFKKKRIIIKEKLFNEMKVNDIFERKKNYKNSKNFICLNNSKLNEKFICNLTNIKKLENNIIQIIFNENNNIFNDNYYNNFLMNRKKILLLLSLIKNCIKIYGNISQIFENDKEKKIKLQLLLLKNGINENEYYIKNINSKKTNNYVWDINNKNNLIKTIKEEEEEYNEEKEFKTNNKINKNKSFKNNNIKKEKNKNYKVKNKTKEKTFKFNKNHIIFNNIIINNIKEKNN